MVRVLGRSRTCVLPQCSFNARPRRNTLQIHHTREMRRQRRARPLKKHRVVRLISFQISFSRRDQTQSQTARGMQTKNQVRTRHRICCKPSRDSPEFAARRTPAGATHVSALLGRIRRHPGGSRLRPRSGSGRGCGGAGRRQGEARAEQPKRGYPPARAGFWTVTRFSFLRGCRVGMCTPFVLFS